MKKPAKKPTKQVKKKLAKKIVKLKKTIKSKKIVAAIKSKIKPKNIKKPGKSKVTPKVKKVRVIAKPKKTKIKINPKIALKKLKIAATTKNSKKTVKSVKSKTIKPKIIKSKSLKSKLVKAKIIKVKVTKSKLKGKSKKTKINMNIKTISKQAPLAKQKSSSSAVGPVVIKPYQAKPGEEYMNFTQLEHFKKILLQWKEQLLQEAETTKQDIQATSANFPDPVDRASLEEEFNLELKARDRERKLIKKIEETIHRMKENAYGYCDDCGAEIGVRRLEARPTATQCIECKTISELKEKQVGEIGREEE